MILAHSWFLVRQVCRTAQQTLRPVFVQYQRVFVLYGRPCLHQGLCDFFRVADRPLR
jgi:hypothetical protein